MEAEEGNELAEGAIEERIVDAIRARLRDFKEQADSITLENVRRIIEKDLRMESYTLDVHKRFIKQSLEKCLQDADEAVSEDSTENPSMKKDTKDKMKKKDHDVKHDEVSNIVNGDEDELNESIVTKALKKRAAYFRKNTEKLSLVEVRRILEADLELEKNALDPFKKFISQQLDEVLQPPEKKKSTNLPKNRSVKVKESKMADLSDGSEDSSSPGISKSEDDEIDEPKEKSKKRISRGKKKEKAKKLKKSEEDDEHPIEMAEPSSSDEDTVKRKKQTPAPAYGKRVEHLKSVIKSCGLGVPPFVYRRVKQVPESERESFLIKELEEILKREGLSTNPSEKEINAVKRKKEKAKELEGIDLSNIVSSTRRRSTSFVVPLKPEVLSESEEEEEEENGEEDEEEEEEEEENEEGDDDMGEEDEEDDKDNDSEEEEDAEDEDEDSE